MTDPRNVVKNPNVATVDDVARVTYENAIDELRSPSPRWDISHHSGVTDLKPEDVQWLRGRVVVEVLPDVVSDVLVIPNAEDRDRRVGPARVVAMGPPGKDKRGREQPHGFGPGALVYVVLPHKSRAIEMDGRKLHVVSQGEVELIHE